MISVGENKDAAYITAYQVGDWTNLWRQAEAVGNCDGYGGGEWQSSLLRLLSCTVEQRAHWFAQPKRWQLRRAHFYTDPDTGDFLTEQEVWRRLGPPRPPVENPELIAWGLLVELEALVESSGTDCIEEEELRILERLTSKVLL